MQRILMKRALADLNAAYMTMQTGDEYDLQVAAYHIQQCVEKVLKQVITDCGGDYTKTRELAGLIAQVPNEQMIVSVDSLDSIGRDEALLSKWESVTRYDDPYMASRKLVSELYTRVSNFYSEVESGLKELDKCSASGKYTSKLPSVPVKGMKLD